MEETSDIEFETPIEEELTGVSASPRSEHLLDCQEESDDCELKEKLVKLPLGRVRNIVKSDPDINLINQEAIFLIAKSTELFIDSLSKEAYRYTAQAKKKIVQKRDVDEAIDHVDSLAFLEGMLEQLM